MSEDPRRAIPRTDAVLALPEFVDAAARLGVPRVKSAVRAAQERARQGLIGVDAVARVALGLLEAPWSGRGVLNATGVVVHTNLGRAPLSESAVAAMVAASGYTDLELDLATNGRRPRGEAVRAALVAVSGAEDALVVNNGAAALVLAVTALAGGGEVIVSRGELVEIGDGFRVGDLVASTGVRLVEVGSTNRTGVRDYAAAVGVQPADTESTSSDPDGLAVAATELGGSGDLHRRVGPNPAVARVLLKVHPSNFTFVGFTAEAGVADLAALARRTQTPLVVDTGSGLLAPDPDLPGEPSASAALRAGADLVVCSADKLLGGPQAGLLLGRADLIGRLRRHPLARALRVDKLALAALEATLTAEPPPVSAYRSLTAVELLPRVQALADAVGGDVVPSQGRVGGGGAPGVDLPGWAVALPSSSGVGVVTASGAVTPDALAARLRTGTPAVLARIEDGRVLIDLRCVPAESDAPLADAICAALGVPGGADQAREAADPRPTGAVGVPSAWR